MVLSLFSVRRHRACSRFGRFHDRLELSRTTRTCSPNSGATIAAKLGAQAKPWTNPFPAE
jgi:hypothetical protein